MSDQQEPTEDERRADQPDPGEDEPLAVRSEPLETEDGRRVVIAQQNVGPGNQVGDGEFKPPTTGRTVEQAADEQEALEREAPVESPRTG